MKRRHQTLLVVIHRPHQGDREIPVVSYLAMEHASESEKEPPLPPESTLVSEGTDWNLHQLAVDALLVPADTPYMSWIRSKMKELFGTPRQVLEKAGWKYMGITHYDTNNGHFKTVEAGLIPDGFELRAVGYAEDRKETEHLFEPSKKP